jgi:hypothetical protein
MLLANAIIFLIFGLIWHRKNRMNFFLKVGMLVMTLLNGAAHFDVRLAKGGDQAEHVQK